MSINYNMEVDKTVTTLNTNTDELQQKVELLEMSHGALIQRLEALEKVTTLNTNTDELRQKVELLEMSHGALIIKRLGPNSR